MTATKKEPKVRKVPEEIYIVDDGETFHGTLTQFKDVFFSNVTELGIIEWAKQNQHKVQKRFKRSRNFVTVTLHDPAKPAKAKFRRRNWGLKKGMKDRLLQYTDSDGKTYEFYLKWTRDSLNTFDKEAPQCHKHEIEYRLLNALVKAINGEEEPE